MSLIVGNVVLKVKKTDPKIPGHVVASALAIICGTIITFIGLIRMGWIVDFISLAAISAFMTGSAINIAVGQFPNLMGITSFDTRAATYKVVINSLKHLGESKLDAAMGVTALAMLYIIRGACNYSAKKTPSKAKFFFFLSTLRTAFVILLYTMISWLVNRHHRAVKFNKFRITGPVPRGKKLSKLKGRLTNLFFRQVSKMPLSPLSIKRSSKLLPRSSQPPLLFYSLSTSQLPNPLGESTITPLTLRRKWWPLASRICSVLSWERILQPVPSQELLSNPKPGCGPLSLVSSLLLLSCSRYMLCLRCSSIFRTPLSLQLLSTPSSTSSPRQMSFINSG